MLYSVCYCSSLKYRSVSHIQTFNGLHQYFLAESVVELFIKTTKLPKKSFPDPACSTAPPKGNRSHVRKICSRHLLFVKRRAGVVSRNFFAEKVCSCTDDLPWQSSWLTCVHAAYLYLTQH